MITKLPRWIWAGAWALAFIAGMVNVVGLLGFEHQAVTHLTGTTSMLGASVSALDVRNTLRLFGVIFSFVAGAVLSAYLIKDSTLQLGRQYGVVLLLEALLLCLAVPFLNNHSTFGDYFASCACGLQNAMVTTYSGSVVRTTHLSGMFTDLGIFLGHALRGVPVDGRRLRLCVTIISAFFCGGIAGAFAFRWLSYETLFIPAALTGFTALSYGLYRIRRGVGIRWFFNREA